MIRRSALRRLLLSSHGKLPRLHTHLFSGRRFSFAIQDDLTLTQLEERLHEQVVLRYSKGGHDLDEIDAEALDEIRISLLLSRLVGLDLNRAKVGTSQQEGGGLGLFAARDIRKDELITCYPGDWALLADGSHVLGNATGLPSSREYEIHIAIGSGPPLALVADPLQVHDAAYLGHMKNDCARCFEASPGAIHEYALSATARSNVDHVMLADCHVAAVAARDIRAGEELYVSYGPGYWLTRQGYSTAEVDAACTALGVEMRTGGELSKAMVKAMKDEGRSGLPSWIVDAFDQTKGKDKN